MGACPARPAELAGKELAVTIDEQSGCISTLRFHGREVLRARPDLAGASVRLTDAGDGTADSLFRHAESRVLKARASHATTGGGKITITGAYADGEIRVPFTREFALGPAPNTLSVREEADFTLLPADREIAEHALDLPLVVSPDEHLRMLAFGGERRSEMFRMDMNDEPRRNQNLSDNRAFWPYWDLGGVLQLPSSYRLWKANHADTGAYPIEEGTGAPGWADYSEPEWGITVQVADARASAPWAAVIDARRGVLSLAAHPAGEMPVDGREYGKRVFRFTLALHESSWPTPVPCELSLPRYRELLDYLNRGERYTHLNYVCGGLGVTFADGARTPAEMDGIFRRVVLKERIQPSILLRLLYRGDAYRMQGLVRAILHKEVPRNRPLAEWEQDAKELLAHIEAEGIAAQ